MPISKPLLSLWLEGKKYRLLLFITRPVSFFQHYKLHDVGNAVFLNFLCIPGVSYIGHILVGQSALAEWVKKRKSSWFLLWISTAAFLLLKQWGKWQEKNFRSKGFHKSYRGKSLSICFLWHPWHFCLNEQCVLHEIRLLSDRATLPTIITGLHLFVRFGFNF